MAFTIIDDDAAPTVAVGDAAAVLEGDDPKTTVNLSFPVTLSAVSGQQVTVTYTLGGTATADDDYTDPATKSVTIAAGTRTANILIPVKGDVVDERNETVTVTLSGATNAAVSSVEGAGEGEGTITDDDAAELAVGDASAVEGGLVSFTIGLDPVSDREVTVKWSTANDAGGTHPAGAADYTAVSPARTATIAAGAASVVVTVQTTQDSLDEPAETFLLQLSAPVNAALATGKDEATGTITDDDAAPPTPVVSITAGSGITEGEAAGFTITASPEPGTALSVDVRVTASGYFGATTGSRTVTIPTGGSATFSVGTVDDALDEIDGSITGMLQGGSGYTVSPTQGSATVQVADNDPPVPAEATVSFEKASYTFNEDDNSPVVKVIMDNALASAIAVRFQAHSAIADIGPDGDVEISLIDFSRGEVGPRDIIFAPGETSREIVLDLVDDDVVEPDEAFTISLSAVSGPVATGAPTTVTLTDDDRAVIRIDPHDSRHPLTERVEEGGQGTIWIQMNKPHQEDVTMDCVVRGTATAGEDYVTLHHRVTIPAGSEAFAVTVQTMDDDLVEGMETFIFIIANPVGSGVSIDPEQSEHTINIVDNDDAPAVPEVSITADGGITEGGHAEFTVTASPRPSAALPVSVGVTARGGFGADTGQRTVTIPTSGSATVTVRTADDAFDEPDGSITGTLQAGSAYRVSSTQGSATVTVADNDEPIPAEATVSFEKTAYTLDEDDNVLHINVAMDEAITSEVRLMLRTHSTDSDAGRGEDAYMTVSDQIFSFAPGETSREIAVYPVDNDMVEPDETFTISIDVLSGPVSAGEPTTVTLTDDDEGVIYIVYNGSDKQVEEGERGVIGIYMSKPNKEDVTVDFVVGGTATAGEDYVALPQRVTIPADVTYVTAHVDTVDDTLGEGTETVEFVLANPVGNSVSLEPNLSDHTMKIMDNDPFAPEASIVALADSITEGGIAYFTITLDPAPVVDFFPVSITTVNSNNYETRTSSNTVNVPAGGVVTYFWHTWDDDDDETGETLEIRLNTDDSYTVSSTHGSAMVNVIDNDLPKPVVSITGGSAITEGGDATFTITASAAHPDAPSGDLSVGVSITVIGSSEITTESETVTVSPGDSVILTIPTTDDAIPDRANGSVTAMLNFSDGYARSASQRMATVSVLDND